MAENWNYRNDVTGCARYHDWKHIIQIGWRSKMEIKNIKITETKLKSWSEISNRPNGKKNGKDL